MQIVRSQSTDGVVRPGVLTDGVVRAIPGVASIAELLRLPLDELRRSVTDAATSGEEIQSSRLLPPLDGRGEVWCAGVTYARSRGARMEESSQEDVYDRVYSAERPELFGKAPAWRLVTDGDPVGIRADSGHDVPEPELGVVANADGEIVAFTVVDDMSSRSIEGENPLYIPQAKVFAGGCAVASGLTPAWEVSGPERLDVRMVIRRDGDEVFSATTSTDQLVRSLEDLVEFLFRANHFPDGVILATGTGIVPELDFALAEDDEVEIEIEQLGRLTNRVRAGTEPFRWLTEDPTNAGATR